MSHSHDAIIAIIQEAVMLMTPFRNQVPSHYELRGPTLVAIAQLTGGAKSGTSNEHIHDAVVSIMGIPAHLANYTNPSGRTPLLESRLGNARTLLKEEGLIQNGNIPGMIRGYWALTPKALRIIDRGGGSGAGRNAWLVGPPSSGSGSQSLVPHQTQGLIRSDEWDSWAGAVKSILSDRRRKITIERETRPDGTVVERIRVE